MPPIGQPLGAVWEFNASSSVYVNNTFEAALEDGTNFELIATDCDYTYFGFSRRFDALIWVAGTVGVYATLTWEYGITNSSWVRFVPTFDDEFETAQGYMLWDVKGATLEADWVSFALTVSDPHVVASVPDGTARFWLRVSSPISVSNRALMNTVVCRGYVSYATALDVQKQLQFRNAFTATSTPTLSTVEDFIRGTEDRMIYDMGESWRPEFIREEFLNFKQYGMKTRYQPIQVIYDVAVYTGSDFESKTTGRNQDYHVDDRTGMIFLSTIFLDAMPPTFRRSYTVRREQGAFKRPVRIRYTHGHDIRSHTLGHHVGRIAVKQACIDLLTDQDFSPLMPVGQDNVSMQQKIDNWQNDVTEFLDKFSKFKVF